MHPDRNATPTLLDSAHVAALLGVTIGTVYKLRTTDPTFPSPTSYDGRSPLYTREALDQYVATRSTRTAGTRGRRPRVMATGTVDPTSFPERLRASIAAGAGRPRVTSQADLLRILGLNPVTFGQRMRSRTRWKEAELAVIADTLGIDVSAANDEVERVRRERRGRPAGS